MESPSNGGFAMFLPTKIWGWKPGTMMITHQVGARGAANKLGFLFCHGQNPYLFSPGPYSVMFSGIMMFRVFCWGSSRHTHLKLIQRDQKNRVAKQIDAKSGVGPILNIIFLSHTSTVVPKKDMKWIWKLHIQIFYLIHLQLSPKKDFLRKARHSLEGSPLVYLFGG